MQHIIVHHPERVVLRVLNRHHLILLEVLGHQNSPSEHRRHIKLLKHRVHVANTPQISDSAIIELTSTLRTTPSIIVHTDARHVLDQII